MTADWEAALQQGLRAHTGKVSHQQPVSFTLTEEMLQDDLVERFTVWWAELQDFHFLLGFTVLALKLTWFSWAAQVLLGTDRKLQAATHCNTRLGK